MLTLRLICCFAAWLCLCGPVWAQSQNPKDLDALTQAEKAARAEAKALDERRKVVTGEISDLENSIEKLSLEIRGFEKDALALQEKKAKIDVNISEIEDAIRLDEAELLKLLAALQRMEANPPPTLALRPDNAIATAQAGQLMTTLSKQLDQRTKVLTAQLTSLAEEQSLADETQAQIEANQRQLERRRAKTQSLVAEKSTLRKSIDTQHEEKQALVTKLAQESESLRELLEKLESEAKSIRPRIKPGRGITQPSKRPALPLALPEGIGPFAKAKGRLTLPVSGPLTSRYGGNEQGLTFRTASRGQVLAPYAGRVEFAGPFKNYDKVIIVDVGEGYYILMTGLGDIFAEIGETLKQGDPVGSMPPDASGSNELYLEVRKDGQTVDPGPWLAL